MATTFMVKETFSQRDFPDYKAPYYFKRAEDLKKIYDHCGMWSHIKLFEKISKIYKLTEKMKECLLYIYSGGLFNPNYVFQINTIDALWKRGLATRGDTPARHALTSSAILMMETCFLLIQNSTIITDDEERLNNLVRDYFEDSLVKEYFDWKK